MQGWFFISTQSSSRGDGTSTDCPSEAFPDPEPSRDEFDPPRLLAYTWIANWHDRPSQRTVVRWELAKFGDGTRVKVTHSGLSQQPIARKDYKGGWSGVVESLKKFVEL
jgi:uncharacterized protein YndB with AHSA1/START domain